MYENICYKKPFLTEVVLRIDFPSPIEGIGNNLPQNVSKAALKRFSISEPQKLHSQEFKISGAEQKVQTRRTELTQWVFHGAQREKQLIIAPNSIIFTTKKYVSYESFIDDVRFFLNEFYKTYKGLSASRMGLRYVNNIAIGEEDPLTWPKYINEGMLGNISYQGDHSNIARSFHILEYNYGDQFLKFQFGLANPDFPAVVKRKQFILDLDSYFHGAIEENEVFDCIQKAHEKIQELFESSITEETRKLMVLEDG